MSAPWTQLEGYAHIRGRLSACQWQVWSYLAECKTPPTRNELDRALGGGQPNAPYSRRLVELERRGIIARGPARACSVTGFQSATWTALAAEPREIARKPSPTSLERRALRSLRREIDAGTPELDPHGFVERWRSALTEILGPQTKEAA